MKLAEKEVTLAVRCHDSIQDSIIDGSFAPGAKLKIDQLSKQLEVGHSPIREALSRLVATGLVEAADNRGFYVARISEADIRDLYKTMLQIELLALAEAIKSGDDAWEAGIVASLHQLAAVETKKQDVAYACWAERNYAFHVALIAGCNSPSLLKVREDLYRRFDRYCRISFNVAHEKLHVNHEEHKKLAAAVLKRDFQEIVDLMTYHIMGSLNDVIKLLKKNKFF